LKNGLEISNMPITVSIVEDNDKLRGRWPVCSTGRTVSAA